MTNSTANNNGINTNDAINYKYENLIEGCSKTAATLNQTGVVYLETTTQLADKLVDIIDSTFGITEIGRVFINIDADPDTKKINGASVLLCFDPTGGQHIVKYGGRNRSHVRTVYDIIPYAAQSGNYQLSDHFKKVIGALLPNNAYDADEFPIFEHPENNRVACVEVDIDAVMCLLLDIKPNSPYACNLMYATQTDVCDGLEEYAVIFSKFIDISGRRRKNKRNNVNYADIGRAFGNRNKGGNNYKGRRR